MATQQITWVTYQKIDCHQCLPTPVILCLPPEIVVAPDCPEAATSEGFPWKTIDATLTQTGFSNSPTCVYSYTLTYDDAQLVPDTVLTSAQILGMVCPGCLTDYIQEQAGNEVFLRLVSPGNYELVTQHGCVYPFSATATDIVSADAGNVIIAGTDGGAFLDCETISDCVGDLTIVSDDVGNLIEVGTDGGAFLDCDSISACVPDVTIVSEDVNNIISVGTDGGAFLSCTVINACLEILESSVLGIGEIDAQPKSDNGLVLDGCTDGGCTFHAQTADENFPGMVSTDAQNFAGVKTFIDDTIFQQEIIGTNGSFFGIRTDSLIGFDNRRVLIAAAGAYTNTRTAQLILGGVDSSSPGYAQIFAGNTAAGRIEIICNGAQPINFYNNGSITARLIDQGRLQLRAGLQTLGNTSARVGGRIFHNITPGGNAAGSFNTTIYTQTVAANTLGVNGDSIELRFAGTTAASGSADKRLRLTVDGTTVFDTAVFTIANGGSFTGDARITRVSATSLAVSVSFLGRDNTTNGLFGPVASVSTITVTLSSNFNIIVLANGALDNDVLLQSMVSDWVSSST